MPKQKETGETWYRWPWIVFELKFHIANLCTVRPIQNGRNFPDDILNTFSWIFKYIFLNENIRISITVSLKFVPKGPVNNSPALDQIIAWQAIVWINVG